MLLNCGVREDPWESLQIKPVHPKINQSWTFIGRTVAEAEAPIVWPPYVKSWLLRKDPEAGQDWRQEETGTTGWDGWMASLTQWIWVWESSRSWRRTGKPGVLQSMVSLRVRPESDWIDWESGSRWAFGTVAHLPIYLLWTSWLQPKLQEGGQLICQVPSETRHKNTTVWNVDSSELPGPAKQN